MARRTYEVFKRTAPAVNEYCLMVPLFQNAVSVLSLGFVMPEGNCKSSINAWQELIDPHETCHVSTCPYRTGWPGVAPEAANSRHSASVRALTIWSGWVPPRMRISSTSGLP